MSSTSAVAQAGAFYKHRGMKADISVGTSWVNETDGSSPALSILSQFKKRKICTSMDRHLCLVVPTEVEASLPILRSDDYFMKPSLKELVAQELIDPGYCSRVRDFTVGRLGYGCVKFLGETDVRWLDIDRIVKFHRHEVVVYEDELDKPAVGQGLNKPAEVSLILQVREQPLESKEVETVIKILKSSTEKQGACFISFDSSKAEWKFLVRHFSRFGLTEDDEDDIVMDDATVQHPEPIHDNEESEFNGQSQVCPAYLSHSLPAHLGLDPIKMQEMRMLMFPAEEDAEELDGAFAHEKQSINKEYIRPALQYSARKASLRSSPSAQRRTPQPLLEYNTNGSDTGVPGTILMTWQNKGMPLRTTKVEGFKYDLKNETPVTGNNSSNIADAALFMGRSFRVGWGPNGILVHTGTPVGKTVSGGGLSSKINVEKVAMDKVVRNENGKVKKELVEFSFTSPLNLHKSIHHETTEVDVGSFKLKLHKPVSDRLTLPEICRSYIEIIEKQLDVPGLSSYARTILMHQVMVWELIKVLFSARETTGYAKSVDADDEEDMMHDKDPSQEIDMEVLPFVRRAQFSYWLQESVCHRVQDEISCLNESSDLQQIFLLLTGRQLDSAVELAASRGDVRLSCLLSQAGGSMVNRSDVAQQIDLWRFNGLDFNFIEKDRLSLYELLAGNIQSALNESKLDWKRFLGLLMWYELPPNASLSVIVQRYQELLETGRAPYPVPVYIDEGPLEEASNWSVGDRFDLSYYLMLLHAYGKEFKVLKTMFSAFSSTHDALDYHMIWHQRAIMEAVGVFSSKDLHVLDMSLVSQLLCLGQCHWAIYVVLQMPYHEDFPYLQAGVIREILFQYCEIWSTQETERKFIEELGVPSAWMHEAMAVYYHYHGDLSTALEHFLECHNWQKAHSIFMTSVAHSLFLSAKHTEIWRLAASMEEHKSEIADWDLGAGIYISFYVIKASLQEEDAMSEVDRLERKNMECRDFFSRLNESLAVWGNKLSVDVRATYSKMAEEVCGLLLSTGDESSTREVQLSSFDTINSAPLPEDLRCCHLQEAVSLFTFFLSEPAS